GISVAMESNCCRSSVMPTSLKYPRSIAIATGASIRRKSVPVFTVAGTGVTAAAGWAAAGLATAAGWEDSGLAATGADVAGGAAGGLDAAGLGAAGALQAAMKSATSRHPAYRRRDDPGRIR